MIILLCKQKGRIPQEPRALHHAHIKALWTDSVWVCARNSRRCMCFVDKECSHGGARWVRKMEKRAVGRSPRCTCSVVAHWEKGNNRIWSSNNILLRLPLLLGLFVCVCVWLFMPPERIVGMNWIRIRWGRWGKESGWSRLFRLGFIDSLSFTSYLIHSTLGERQWIECVFLCVREKKVIREINSEWVCLSFPLNDSRSKWPCYWNQRPSFGGKSASCRNSAI